MLSRRTLLQGLSGGVSLLAAEGSGISFLSNEAHAANKLINIQEYSAAKGEPILIDPVYATTRNFVGRPLRRYDKPECLSNPAVIESLMNINRRLRHREDLTINLQLLVKDAY